MALPTQQSEDMTVFGKQSDWKFCCTSHYTTEHSRGKVRDQDRRKAALVEDILPSVIILVTTRCQVILDTQKNVENVIKSLTAKL